MEHQRLSILLRQGADTQDYLLPTEFRILDSAVQAGACKRIYDLDCGDGSGAFVVAHQGYPVSGLPSRLGAFAVRSVWFP